MRYLAININDTLDQEWYYKCDSLIDCYKYFESLGEGHGPKAAIYDMELNKYLWIEETRLSDDERLNNIVFEAIKKIDAAN